MDLFFDNQKPKYPTGVYPPLAEGVGKWLRLRALVRRLVHRSFSKDGSFSEGGEI